MASTELSRAHEPALDPPPNNNQTAVAPDPDEDADAYEVRIQEEKSTQFKRLKDDARAIYGQVRGIPGVRSPEKWAEMLEKAGDDIGNGRFIVRQLGAERYLDPEMVAVLINLRQNLLADIPKPSTSAVAAKPVDGVGLPGSAFSVGTSLIGALQPVGNTTIFPFHCMASLHTAS
jgi:hypothetical protein